MPIFSKQHRDYKVEKSRLNSLEYDINKMNNEGYELLFCFSSPNDNVIVHIYRFTE